MSQDNSQEQGPINPEVEQPLDFGLELYSVINPDLGPTKLPIDFRNGFSFGNYTFRKWGEYDTKNPPK